jgi:N,N-dimethylformamidase
VEEALEVHAGLGGARSPLVRCDLVYFETPRGGAVFATGSIAWCGALSAANYDNAVSRITENVLRHFMLGIS